jgi:STE24 endopeptidase
MNDTVLGHNGPTEDATPVIDLDRQRQAAELARARYLLVAAHLVVLAAYVLGWLVTGLSVGVAAALDSLTLARPVTVALYLSAFGLCYVPASLALSFADYRLERRYGLSRQRPPAWLADQARWGLLGWVFGLLVGEMLYGLLAAAGNWWWLWGAVALFAINALLTNLVPVLIVPLFYKMTPLSDAALTARLTALAERAGTHVRGVFTLDFSRRTTAANAALMGLGNTRRVVLSDTLLSEWPADEIEVVLAHELAHHVHGDIWKSMVVDGLLTAAGLGLVALVLSWAAPAAGFPELADIAAFPLLALALGVFGLVTLPLENAYSRWRESLADAYALVLTRNPAAFTAAMTRLANHNLSQVDPPRWAIWLLYSHPPIGERLRMAAEHQDVRSG